MNISVHLSYLGYGLLEAWSICLFFIQGTDSVASAHPALNNLSSLAVTAGTLALLLLCRKRDAIPNHRVAMAAGGVLNAAATLCMLLGTGPVAVAGYGLSGLVNAWLWVGWGDIYAALDTETAEKTAIASATLQAVLVALILWLPPHARLVVLALLAPTASVLYLLARRNLAGGGPVLVSDHTAPGRTATGRQLAKLLLAGLGAPIAILYFLLDRSMPLPDLPSGLDMALVAGLLLFIVALYGFVRFSHGFSAESIFRTTASLLVIAIVVNALGFSAATASTLLFAAMLLCQYLLLLYAARLARQGFGNTVFSFSVVQLVNHGSGFLGTMASVALYGTALVSGPGVAMAIPTVLLGLLFGLSLALQRGPSGTALPETPEEASPVNLASFAAERGLSPRETEVFELLVKGRSAPFIRDELCISLNTVTSHIKHIYTKLDVHTRQELIDLVEQTQGAPRG